MVKFTYTLREHGWASIHATLDAAELEFQVSYMSPALEDVVSSVVALLSGETVTRFALIDEPGAYCWVLTRKDDALHILIAHLNSMYRTECYIKKKRLGQPPPEEEGQFVATAKCPFLEFAQAIADMIQDIDRQYSPSDFEHAQNSPVPPHLSAVLRQLLGE